MYRKKLMTIVVSMALLTASYTVGSAYEETTVKSRTDRTGNDIKEEQQKHLRIQRRLPRQQNSQSRETPAAPTQPTEAPTQPTTDCRIEGRRPSRRHRHRRQKDDPAVYTGRDAAIYAGADRAVYAGRDTAIHAGRDATIPHRARQSRPHWARRSHPHRADRAVYTG